MIIQLARIPNLEELSYNHREYDCHVYISVTHVHVQSNPLWVLHCSFMTMITFQPIHVKSVGVRSQCEWMLLLITTNKHSNTTCIIQFFHPIKLSICWISGVKDVIWFNKLILHKAGCQHTFCTENASQTLETVHIICSLSDDASSTYKHTFTTSLYITLIQLVIFVPLYIKSCLC